MDLGPDAHHDGALRVLCGLHDVPAVLQEDAVPETGTVGRGECIPES